MVSIQKTDSRNEKHKLRQVQIDIKMLLDESNNL